MNFTVLTGGTWFEGFWIWRANLMAATPVKCALWRFRENATSVIASSKVTSGALAPGWNFVPVPVKIPLSVGTAYNASMGVNGPFCDIAGYWGAADLFPGGIANGPLRTFSSQDGTYKAPFSIDAMTFSTASADAWTTAGLVTDTGQGGGASGGNNFWVDVQVSDTPPAGYNGPYRFFPSQFYWDDAGEGNVDNATAYTLASEFILSQPCSINNVHFFSPPGATGGLPTKWAIWKVSNQSRVYEVAGPSWDGAQGTHWVSTTGTGFVLDAATRYKVSVHNANGASGGWSGKRHGFFDTFGTVRVYAPDGVTWGPLHLMGKSDATPTPLLSSGSQVGPDPQPGQCTFQIGDAYPGLYVHDSNSNGQFYGVDLSVTPVPLPVAGSGGGGFASRGRRPAGAGIPSVHPTWRKPGEE